jgi:hypothetical protein
MNKKNLTIGALAAAAILVGGWSMAGAQDHQGMRHGAAQHQNHAAGDADETKKKTPKRSAKTKRPAAGAHVH